MTARQAVLGMDQGGFAFGTKRVFSDISFLLDGQRAALVGENGVGKSTLLKCLSGELELDRGKLIRSRNLRVGVVSQETPPGQEDLTVHDLLRLSLARIGAGDEDWRINILLDELGMAQDLSDAPLSSLSGGWRRLVHIAGIARLEAPDILILDEPTNHLDLGNIATLERWLTVEFKLPMLVVSHDRAFLDRVTERTLFLRSDGLHDFRASFSHAREELLRRDAAAATQRKLEDQEIRRLEQAAARYKVWAVKNPALNKRKNAIETRIARLEAAKPDPYKARQRRLGLSDAEIEAKVALRVSDLVVRAPDASRVLIQIPRLAIASGDKVALLGVNGAGKSTFLKALAEAYAARDPHYDAAAAIRFNPSSRLAYFDQGLRDVPLDEAPLHYVMSAAPEVTRQDAMRHLAQAGFRKTGEPIATLSSGERARLAFLHMKLRRPNLYLLDEPTNHLDIEGQEALEAELDEREVSCVFVSHDRHFVRAAASRFLEIRAKRLVEVEDPEAFFESQDTMRG